MAGAVVVLVVCLASQGIAATGKFIANNTPKYVPTAKNLATEDPAKLIEVSFWLAPLNRAALDAVAKQLPWGCQTLESTRKTREPWVIDGHLDLGA
jgi:hypothetical protein